MEPRPAGKLEWKSPSRLLRARSQDIKQNGQNLPVWSLGRHLSSIDIDNEWNRRIDESTNRLKGGHDSGVSDTPDAQRMQADLHVCRPEACRTQSSDKVQ